MTTTTDHLLDAEDVARILRRPRRWVIEATARGDIPAVKVGKFWRYDHEAIDAYKHRNRHGLWAQPARSRAARRAQ